MLFRSVPARILGIGDRKGKLAVDMDADITLFDGDFNYALTMVNGEIVHNQIPTS